MAMENIVGGACGHPRRGRAWRSLVRGMLERLIGFVVYEASTLNVQRRAESE